MIRIKKEKENNDKQKKIENFLSSKMALYYHPYFTFHYRSIAFLLWIWLVTGAVFAILPDFITPAIPVEIIYGGAFALVLSNLINLIFLLLLVPKIKVENTEKAPEYQEGNLDVKVPL